MPKPGLENWMRKRVIEKLGEICRDTGVSQRKIAEEIEMETGVTFPAMNVTRLLQGGLSLTNLTHIIDWIARRHDKDFRKKLKPIERTRILCEDIRDFYSYEHAGDRKRIALSETLSGIYVAMKAEPASNFVSLKNALLDKNWHGTGREDYIRSRSVVVLRHIGSACFLAAEMSFSRFCDKSMRSERNSLSQGFACLSGSTLMVQLANCIDRSPKLHLIGLNTGGADLAERQGRPYATLDQAIAERALLLEEHRAAISLELSLRGMCFQKFIDDCGDSELLEAVSNEENVYFRKPEDIMEKANDHFPLGENSDIAELEKMLSNPLFFGGIL